MPTERKYQAVVIGKDANWDAATDEVNKLLNSGWTMNTPSHGPTCTVLEFYKDTND